MKKLTINKPIRVNDASLEDLFDDDLTSNWQLKAERLLKRRERKLRQQMMHY